MAIVHIKPGQDFFSGEHNADHAAFGFTKSVPAGTARNHAMDPSRVNDNPDYAEKARGGPARRLANGGPPQQAPVADPSEHFPPSPTTPAPMQQMARGGRYAEGGPSTNDITDVTRDAETQHKTPNWRASSRSKDDDFAKGGRAKGYQLGGMTQGVPSQRPQGVPAGANPAASAMNRATITMPVSDATMAARGAMNTGRALGAKQAVAGLANAARSRGAMPQSAPGAAQAVGAQPPPAMGGPGVPTMAGGGKFRPGGTPGKLHREIGVPEGEKIPAGRLRAATHSHDPEIRRDAIRAETMKKWAK